MKWSLDPFALDMTVCNTMNIQRNALKCRIQSISTEIQRKKKHERLWQGTLREMNKIDETIIDSKAQKSQDNSNVSQEKDKTEKVQAES